MLDLARLNNSDFKEFDNIISILFEPSPLSEILFPHRPFPSFGKSLLLKTDALLKTTQELINDLSNTNKLKVVNAHPRIGAVKSSLSAHSRNEQYSQQLEDEVNVNQELQKLNAEYENVHGFKFVTFVNGRSRKDILPEMRERIHLDTGKELEKGLEAMILIAKDRIKKST